MNAVPWIVGFPLASSVLLGLVGARLGERTVGAIASLSVLAAFAAGLVGWSGVSATESGAIRAVLFEWITVADLRVAAALQLDRLSALLVLVVTGVGFLIHVYSTEYMRGEDGYARYFTYLNLFTASMLLLVLGANVLVMFVGWELVGLCSYLLIGFWFERPAAAAAGRKAFVVNRIGDAAFLLGICLLFVTLGTLDFAEISRALGDHPQQAVLATLPAIALLLFVGATGKSAQLPLHVWLPDAMEGPTPVSALIHAATMVTAGVYMIARLWPLFAAAPGVLTGVVAVVGAATALFAATVAIGQNDLKRVLAWSTISQLGYMFMALGVGAATSGLFHLTTHAFFKALLFLAAGSVMHAMHGVIDLRRLGGLRHAMPVTFAGFAIGAIALSGVPPFAGFWSKDEILHAAYASGQVPLWIVGTITAGVTAFYITRAALLTFTGTPADRKAHPHEAGPAMKIAMILLAVLSAAGGLIGAKFLGAPFEHYLELMFHAEAHAEAANHAAGGLSEGALIAISIVVAVLGIAFAWSLFNRRRNVTLGGLAALAARQWGLEDLYRAAIVRPLEALAIALAGRFDPGVIDGAANGIGAAFVGAGARVRAWQSGYVRRYAAGVLVSAILVLGYWLLR
ncbi:MAG: NADH-quinone oxidoreductase subunit L [Armatimonadetes bacterium]|nr:NADH-quinone oxidoreductase subunit L [Armatimonadota bacterium]